MKNLLPGTTIGVIGAIVGVVTLVLTMGSHVVRIGSYAERVEANSASIKILLTLPERMAAVETTLAAQVRQFERWEAALSKLALRNVPPEFDRRDAAFVTLPPSDGPP